MDDDAASPWAIIDGNKARSRRTADIRLWLSAFHHAASSSAAKPPAGAVEPPTTLTTMSIAELRSASRQPRRSLRPSQDRLRRSAHPGSAYWQRTSGRDTCAPAFRKGLNDSRADALCTARNERTTVARWRSKFKGRFPETRSSRAQAKSGIEDQSDYQESSPVSRLVTTSCLVLPEANGSLV